ncbi:antitermination protein [Enterobacteriaceae bacterium H20N1]|uniref:Antitermination protein n=1 Tax=Dryocola boscaweniae TaxID=2925397 RepID=A0A9X2W5V5_9ENTR|nr:antitermination protein N [Dryocola boscaweniae]MCT4701531.1 antitermination protein [Dryocola boscaweniae]MCT4718558.1 antitermination protein [Dryocola boscaweniae]
MDAQARRRERRKAKQAAWKTANPLLVGFCAMPDPRLILRLNRKPEDRVAKALEVVNEYGLQIQQNAEKYQRLREQQQQKNHRVYQSQPKRPSGSPDARGKEKRHAKSIPPV